MTPTQAIEDVQVVPTLKPSRGIRAVRLRRASMDLGLNDRGAAQVVLGDVLGEDRLGHLPLEPAEFEFPMLHFGRVSFLPGGDLHLSPVGPGCYAYLPVKRRQQLLTVHGRRAVGHRNG